MPFMPFSILGMWFRGLLSLAILGGGVFFLTQWYRNLPSEEVVAVRRENGAIIESRPVEGPVARVSAWRPGVDQQTARLAGAMALLLVAFAGRLIGAFILHPRRRGDDEPNAFRNGEVHRLQRPDGTELQVECYGPADAPTIVLTHGWGNNCTEWYYLKRQLAPTYRVIVWDLPGAGLSTRSRNNDYSLEKMAHDLQAVIAVAGECPVVLLGHSIGGMIILTFCRLFPEALKHRVSGIGLVHTTYTNPLRTTSWSKLYTALQKPVIEPLLHLTVWFSPLVWLMNWMSYINGSAHSSAARQSFAGTETRGQLDFAARFSVKISPAVLARGMFGMLRYDASAVLSRVRVPALIVAGDRDQTTKPEASVFMNSKLPLPELVTLSPAKHLGLIERHEDFGREVEKFCAARTPQQRTGDLVSAR